MLEIRRYLTGSGKDVFGAWMSGLRDDRTKAEIVARIDRLSLGNFGDCKALGHGLFELRIDGGQATESITRWRAELVCCCVSACHPEAAESLPQPRTPNEGSVHSCSSVAGGRLHRSFGPTKNLGLRMTALARSATGIIRTS